MSDIGEVIVFSKAFSGSGSSSSGSFTIPIFTIADGHEDVTCNMTFEQIKAAVDAGNCFFAKLINDGGTVYLSLHYYNEGIETMQIGFQQIFITPQGVDGVGILCDSNDEFSLFDMIYPTSIGEPSTS